MKIIQFLASKNNSYLPGMSNTHSTGCSMFHLPKTHYMRGQIFDKIYINRKNIFNFFIQDLITRSSKNKISMIYTDLIQLVGQYMTFDEFAKAHPEIELTQNDWYSILDGRTMRTQKKELKQRYLDEFDADWTNRRNVAFEILHHAKKTSN